MTKTGAVSHHAIGKALRKEFTEAGLLNTKRYDPSEIYVQSTFKHRTIHSANSQLEGLFGKELTWPTKNNTIFHIHHVPLSEDGMMSMSNMTCPRLSASFRELRSDVKTKEMLDKNAAFMEPLIYEPLRKKTGLIKATELELLDLGNFIDWTKRDGRNINFEMSAKDLALTEAMIEV